MGAGDGHEGLLPRAGAVTFLVLFGILLTAVGGFFAVAASPLGDPTAGTMPPDGSGRALVSRLVPALDDDAAIAELVPADSASERTELREACGPVVEQNPSVTILDDVTPTPFRVVIGDTTESSATTGCTIGFRWVKDEGWHVGPITR